MTQEYEVHEVATIFPSMDRAEFDALVRDIGEHDLREPIWLCEGKIIDGRHRYLACKACGRAPRFRDWDGNGSLVSFVVSLNLKRRHLTASQRAAVAVDAVPHLAEEARVRQGARTDLTSANSQADVRPFGRASAHAAEMMGTNHSYVEEASRIQLTAPEVFEAIRNGTVNIPEARQLERLPEEQRCEVLGRARDEERDIRAVYRDVTQHARAAAVVQDMASPAALGRFPVLYADPPWRYDHSLTRNRDVENQYPTLSVEDICRLPVAEAAFDDSVLFLWATSPKLQEALQVMAAWGFTYTTSMVWVKDKIGMGYYARQQHELLLIGKRGQLPVPLPENRPSSVIEAPRLEHSAKPELVYATIERMYPQLPLLELFARVPRGGMWTSWGNDVRLEAQA